MNDTTLEKLNAIIERTKTEDKITLRDLFGPAMELSVEHQEDADRFFEALVDFAVRTNAISEEQKTLPREELEAIQRSNLGYYAGYYDHETRIRVEKLFNCSHPIFGGASRGEPTPLEAFTKGVNAADEVKSSDVG